MNYTFQLSCQYHLRCAIQTADIHRLGCPHRITAARADIFSGGAGFGNRRWRSWCVCAGSCDPETTAFVPVNENVTQIIVQAELQQAVAGRCDRPSVFFMMIHKKAMFLCAVPKFPIVVSTATAAILDSCHKIMVVNHFVQQCGGNVFDGTCQRTCTDVDLVKCSTFGDPGVITEGEVSISLWRGLDCDCGS